MNNQMEMGAEWLMPDPLWELVEPVLPPEPAKPKGGRPRVDRRGVMDGIFYRLRTGCQWKAIPRSLVAGSTAHDYFQAWQEAGVFYRLWHEALKVYDDKVGIEWFWQALDGAMTKAPLGGEATGRNPTDRGKQGVKRSLLSDGRGVPLAVAVEGANRHDMKLVGPTLYQIAIARPEPTEEEPQNLSMDKGYDYEPVRELLEQWGYTAHIRTRGEEKQQKQTVPGYRARRWVVERSHSWINRFRALLIRWEKQVDNYLALLHLACAFITLRAASTFQPA
jgi:putative transposase